MSAEVIALSLGEVLWASDRVDNYQIISDALNADWNPSFADWTNFRAKRPDDPKLSA
jgi:hypothetical protein